MVNNICPVCKAVVSENERLCPFCGTELHQKTTNSEKKKSYYDNVSNSQNNASRQPSYVPYPQNNTYVPPQTQSHNRSTSVNSDKKNNTAKKVIISLIITFVIVFGFLFTIGIIISIGENVEQENLQTVFDQQVDTVKIPSIDSQDREPTNKVAGNTNLFENDKYFIYKLTQLECVNDDYYDRNFYVYIDKPNNEDVAYSCDKYSGKLDNEIYTLNFSTRGDFSERAEYTYVGSSKTITKLDNLKIGDVTFEVYEIRGEYSYYYECMSKPVDNDEGYLNITFYSSDEEHVDYKELIRHVSTTKTYDEE